MREHTPRDPSPDHPDRLERLEGLDPDLDIDVVDGELVPRRAHTTRPPAAASS